MARHSFHDAGHAHFLTFSCFRRKQLLCSDDACMILARHMDLAREKHDFALWAYVFMPDHVHLLIHPNRDPYSISAILRDIKGPSSRELTQLWQDGSPRKLIGLEVEIAGQRHFRVWQAGGGYDRNLHSVPLIARAMDYIEWNPVRKQYVSEPMAWTWSSAPARGGVKDVPLRIDEFEVQ